MVRAAQAAAFLPADSCDSCILTAARGSAAAGDHPGASRTFPEPGLGAFFAHFLADQPGLTGFLLEAEAAGQCHGRAEHSVTGIATTRTVRIVLAGVDAAPHLVVVAAGSAAEFVDRHGEEEKNREDQLAGRFQRTE
jgi:hypothetical protein